MSRLPIDNQRSCSSRRDEFNVSIATDISEEFYLHNRYIQSVYLKTMFHGKCTDITNMASAQLLKLAEEEDKHTKELCLMLRRLKEINSLMRVLISLERETVTSFSVKDNAQKEMGVLQVLIDDLEKSLNQLPLKNMQLLSNSEKLALSEIFKTVHHLLNQTFDNFKEAAVDQSLLAGKLQCILTAELKTKMDKCDSLMKIISDLVLKNSTKIAAETAESCLKIV